MFLWLVSHSLWCHVPGVVAVAVSLVRSVRIYRSALQPQRVSRKSADVRELVKKVSSIFEEGRKIKDQGI